jgi:hypothetical protein
VVHQSGFDEFNDAAARGRCRPPSCGHTLIRPDKNSGFFRKGLDPDSFFYKFPLNTPEGLKTIASLLNRGWFGMKCQVGLRFSLFSVPSQSMMDRCPDSSCLLPRFTCRRTSHLSGGNEWTHPFLSSPARSKREQYGSGDSEEENSGASRQECKPERWVYRVPPTGFEPVLQA